MTVAKILLIDDSATNRLLVKAYFVGQRCEFTEAADGREALAAFRKAPPDLVICDVFMPGISGWDFVRAVRRDGRAGVNRVPVILASSKREEDIAQRSLDAGADLFLKKPLAGEQLLHAVRDLLEKAEVRKRAAAK